MIKVFRSGGVVSSDKPRVFTHDVTAITMFAGRHDADSL